MSTVSANPIRMPRLSDSMQEGVIVSWLVQDGSQVAVGQAIVEVETDKATMPYEAEVAGTIHLRAAEGETVAVGDLIAVIGDEPEAGAEPSGRSTASGAGLPANGSAAVTRSGADPAAVAASARQVGRVDASPVARRVARERGLDLGAIVGTGPHGRIVKADVVAAHVDSTRDAQTSTDAGASVPDAAAQAAPAAPPSAKGEISVRELTRRQQVIARRMAEAKATAPEFVLTAEIEMETAVTLRSQLRELVGPDGPVPSYNDFVVKACALALREHPLANGSYRDGHFELHERVNVGIAVAAADTLVVPTIFDADRKSLGEIARAARELSVKGRDGTITPAELGGGTFSVSNLGMFGVDEFTAVLNPPQAAILAVGALKQRAVVRDGVLVARHMMTVSLTCDHRILYGADAAEFLAAIRRRLEAPGALVL